MRRDTLRSLRKKGETPAQTLARVHHEAYLVEEFGLPGSGVPHLNFLKLVNAGIIEPSVMPKKRNAFRVVLQAAEIFANMLDKERREAKTWSLNQWEKEIDTFRGVPEKSADVSPETILLPGHGIPEVRWMNQTPEDLSDAVQAALRGLPHPQEPHAAITDSPPELQGYMKDAYKQALERAGMYCKALGDLVGDELTMATQQDFTAEETDKRRERRLKIIRRDVSDAILQGWSKEELAEKLKAHTGDYVRDWNRVAMTELQGAYNDAAVLTAIKLHGTSARIARIPETTACGDCQRLFLEAGLPKIFRVIDIIKNGSNVGLRPLEWKPTIWPLHPRCRCGVVPVPEGSKADRSGNLIAE